MLNSEMIFEKIFFQFRVSVLKKNLTLVQQPNFCTLNYSDFNERDLVGLLCKDDEQAFKILYESYSNRLLGYLIKFTKSEDDAAEILQETFMRIWNNRKTLDPLKSFRSYLFRIASNLVYDYFRAKALKKKIHAVLTDQNPVTVEEEEIIFKKEDSRLINEAIRSLSPKRRKIFWLIKIEGHSYSEVSQLLNISSSTINDHVVKATKLIRDKLLLYHSIESAIILSIIFAG